MKTLLRRFKSRLRTGLFMLLLLAFTATPVFAQTQQVQLLEQILNGLSSLLDGIANGLFRIGEAVVSAIMWIINSIVGIVNFFATAIQTVVNFFADFILRIVNAFIRFVGDIGAFIIMVVEQVIDFVVAIVINIIEIIEVVAMAVNVIIAIAQLILHYIGQAFTLFFSIVNGLNDATATPIPGLPRCISEPVQHDLCAIWYMIDWTLIAPGTPGEFIVPLFVLMIDVFILFYIVAAVMRLLRWWQGVYLVQ